MLKYLLIISLSFGLVACNTIAGIGKDVQSGEKVNQTPTQP